jgi:hypothetical protein
VQKIDVSRVIADEVARWDGLLPVEVARRGWRGLDDSTRRRLVDQGLKTFTESQYRTALRQVLRDLVGGADDLRHGSSLSANADAERKLPIEGEDVTVLGDFVLGQRGGDPADPVAVGLAYQEADRLLGEAAERRRIAKERGLLS